MCFPHAMLDEVSVDLNFTSSDARRVGTGAHPERTPHCARGESPDYIEEVQYGQLSIVGLISLGSFYSAQDESLLGWSF